MWQQLVAGVARVPPAAWVAAMTANLILTIATWSTARSRIRRTGQRLANPGLVDADRRTRDTALTVAAMVPAALFLIMVIAGSMHGLVAFGYRVLGWRGGWEYLVPGTLDGVSVAFGLLAFRAVRRGKAPDRSYRVVWGAAGASASINFSYEYGQSGNILAGGYVGLLSVLGMVMFHEFLSQFEDGVDNHIRRQNPKFGLRWLTWPTNTLLAAVAWRNHPPVEGTPGTIAAAIANLNRVRELKKAARAGSAVSGPVPAAASRNPPTQAEAAELSPTRPAPSAATEAHMRHQPERGSGARTPRRRHPANDTTPDGGNVRVPTTEATIRDWADTWIRMSADEDLWSGPLTDDDLTRTRYGRSARQLRRLRHAVLSGALRRQAEQLGLTLPDNFVDRPSANTPRSNRSATPDTDAGLDQAPVA